MCTRTHPKIIAVSITSDNLSDGLWSELAKWQNNHPFTKECFKWTKTRVFSRQHPETWYISARSFAKGATEEALGQTLAGVHADNVLFVLDESGGIPLAVMAAASAALANSHLDGTDAKIVQAGNPFLLQGPLYRACTTERGKWYVVEITGDPDDPKRAPRISKEWARGEIEKYGKDNPWVLVNVFGKFPPSSLNSLLGPDEVTASMNRQIRESDYMDSQKRLGVDCARFGDDLTIIFPRQGLAAFKPVEMRNARSNEIAARVMLAKSRWGSEQEFIDGTGGYGSGVVDSMIQAGTTPHEIHFSGKAIDSRYFNKRAEIWFNMAEWVKRGGALPDNPELRKELTEVTYTFKNGKFVIEPKDKIKERIGRSPDYADALCLTFSIPELPGKTEFDFLKNDGKARFEYDPFA